LAKARLDKKEQFIHLGGEGMEEGPIPQKREVGR